MKSNEWLPEDLGLVAWTYDPVVASTSPAITAGTLYLSRVRLRKPAAVGNLYICVGTAGVTLTAGQCFAGIWKADGTLVALTAEQSAQWQVQGPKTMPLVGGPFQLAAGDYYLGVWANGTTPPGFFRCTNTGGMANMGSNVGSTPGGFLRIGTADTGLTTSPANPANIAGISSGTQSPWMAVGA